MPIYSGVSGANRQVTKVPVGVGGANRECKSAWAGAGGANRQVFSSANCSISVSVTEENGEEGSYTINSDKSITFTARAAETEKGNKGGCGIRITVEPNISIATDDQTVLVRFQNPSYNRNGDLVLRTSLNRAVSRPYSVVVNDPQIGPIEISRFSTSGNGTYRFEIEGFDIGSFTATIPVGGIIINNVPMIPV